jgi:hypothetical protein
VQLPFDSHVLHLPKRCHYLSSCWDLPGETIEFPQFFFCSGPTGAKMAGTSGTGLSQWQVRKATWSRLWATAVRPRLQPRKIPVPRDEPGIRLIPAPQSYADFRAPSLIVPANVPAAEASFLTNSLARFYHWMQDVYPVVSPPQPLANPDRRQRVREAFTPQFGEMIEPPRWHQDLVEAESAGNLLGALATAGPFAKLLRRPEADDGSFVIDLTHMSAYPVRPGLSTLGCRIRYASDGPGVVVRSIWHGGRDHLPADSAWPFVEQVALCCMATHLTVWRHGMQYHVGGVGPMAALSHNLPPTHPVRRFLAPHIDLTISTNYHTHITLRRSGFDVTGFSFPYETILRFYDDGVRSFDISELDPAVSAERRGIPEHLGGEYQAQSRRYFDLFRSYATAYLRRYYADDTAPARDPALRGWFEDVHRFVPNGIRHYVGELSLQGLIRLCTLFIYTVTVEHEENTMWNYAPFLPTVVHADGSGLTVGEVQAVVNFQFLISSAKNRLMSDFSHLALDTEAAVIMREFQEGLSKLERQMEGEPDRHWRVLPRTLEASVSA